MEKVIETKTLAQNFLPLTEYKNRGRSSNGNKVSLIGLSETLFNLARRIFLKKYQAVLMGRQLSNMRQRKRDNEKMVQDPRAFRTPEDRSS